MQEPILFLCHRIPFPPNKGDKITTFNLLKYLAKRYEVHLGCFIDDPFDRQYISELNKYAVTVKCVDICDRKLTISGVKALLSGASITTQHYVSKDLQHWVHSTIKKFEISRLFIYSTSMLQFVQHPMYRQHTKVLDMADVDSDKWRQYAERKPPYIRWIYTREQRILAQLEQQALHDFDAVSLITDEEAALFRSLSPEVLSSKISTLSNGVDTQYFSPDAEFDLTDLPPLHGPSICFTGAMDYWANEDAVVWFCNEVWPKIISQRPDAHFYIVGGNPTQNVRNLENHCNVIVTGRVIDVRPYLNACHAAVAPMRIARGVQNKVLEAMSMAKPVVMTSMGKEGIAIDDDQQELVTDSVKKMASLLLSLLGQSENWPQNRRWIQHYYSWDGALSKIPELLAKHHST